MVSLLFRLISVFALGLTACILITAFHSRGASCNHSMHITFLIGKNCQNIRFFCSHSSLPLYVSRMFFASNSISSIAFKPNSLLTSPYDPWGSFCNICLNRIAEPKCICGNARWIEYFFFLVSSRVFVGICKWLWAAGMMHSKRGKQEKKEKKYKWRSFWLVWFQISLCMRPNPFSNCNRACYIITAIMVRITYNNIICPYMHACTCTTTLFHSLLQEEG